MTPLATTGVMTMTGGRRAMWTAMTAVMIAATTPPRLLVPRTPITAPLRRGTSPGIETPAISAPLPATWTTGAGATLATVPGETATATPPCPLLWTTGAGTGKSRRPVPGMGAVTIAVLCIGMTTCLRPAHPHPRGTLIPWIVRHYQEAVIRMNTTAGVDTRTTTRRETVTTRGGMMVTAGPRAGARLLHRPTLAGTATENTRTRLISFPPPPPPP
mmetsp:Transcript_10573/g.19160  ORF Transcript_10573/g.19160 Transcript_10573/m.19160 type:complete len:216 (-) Transcript_10573:12-659(-)